FQLSPLLFPVSEEVDEATQVSGSVQYSVCGYGEMSSCLFPRHSHVKHKLVQVPAPPVHVQHFCLNVRRCPWGQYLFLPSLLHRVALVVEGGRHVEAWESFAVPHAHLVEGLRLVPHNLTSDENRQLRTERKRYVFKRTP